MAEIEFNKVRLLITNSTIEFIKNYGVTFCGTTDFDEFREEYIKSSDTKAWRLFILINMMKDKRLLSVFDPPTNGTLYIEVTEKEWAEEISDQIKLMD